MDTFDVVLWQDDLSDGSPCYAAWCTSVLGVSGQGQTEDEAIADILSAMAANIFDPWPEDWPSVQDAKIAKAEQEQLVAELMESGVWHRLHRVTRDDLQAVHAATQGSAEAVR